MAEDFDPYYLWLGIPPRERPAHHYRLLGITLFEANPTVIESAADRQMSHLRSVQAGKHSALSQRLLNEVAAAKVCLLRPQQKAKYDSALRAKLEADAAKSAAKADARPGAAPAARTEPIAATPAATAETSFWEDVTGAGAARTAATLATSRRRTTAAGSASFKKFWPLALVAAACVVVAGAVVVMNSSGNTSGSQSQESSADHAVAPKTDEAVLHFDWPPAERIGLTLTIDNARLTAPATGPWEYRCKAVRHHIVASRHGYKPIDRTVDPAADGAVSIAERWQPLATLVLDWPLSQRASAVLSLDDQVLPIGTAQPMVIAVEPGTHVVRVTRLGSLGIEKNVTIAADEHQNLAIAPTAAPATLTIHWSAQDRTGSELNVDGTLHPLDNENGDAVSLVLPPGAHKIEIRRPGFKTFADMLILGAAEQKSITPGWTANLNPATTAITSSTPPDSTFPATAPDKSSPADTNAAEKRPIPSDVEQERIAKQLGDSYRPTHDLAHNLDQAKTLSDLGHKAAQPAERYVMLNKAAELAADGGDLALAFATVDSLDAEFILPTVDLKQKLFDKLTKLSLNEQQATEAVNAAGRLIQDAIAADRYEAAAAVAASASKILSKRAFDPDFRRDSEKVLNMYHAQISLLESQFSVLQKTKQALAANAADPTANLTLGRWYCFYKGDWKMGLPYLSKSGDKHLVQAAQQELHLSAEATRKAQLADQWWDIASRESGSLADAIRLHAGDLYRAVLPELDSGAKQAAIQRRLAEVNEIHSRVGDVLGQHSGPIVFQRNRWYDILKLVDVKLDGNPDTWTRNSSRISCRPGFGVPRIRFPVVVDGGYDFEFEFGEDSRPVGQVHTIYFLGEHPAGFVLADGLYSGYDLVGGRPASIRKTNPYVNYKFSIQPTVHYQQLLSVRPFKGGSAAVSVMLNGQQLVAPWRGDPSALVQTSVLQGQPTPTQLSVEVPSGYGLAIYSARLRIVNGQGHVERPGQSDAQSSSR